MTTVPENVEWEVLENYPLAVQDFDKTSFDLKILSVQQEGRWCTGFEILKLLIPKPGAVKEQQALPGTCLDYLLEHPSEIPKEFEGKQIVFFGTVYRPAGTKKVAHASVRVLYQDSNGEWLFRYKCLDSEFNVIVSPNTSLRLAVTKSLG